MKSIFKSCLSLVLIFSLLYSPLARATDASNDFHQTCDQSLQDVQNKTSTQGDQKMAYCETADLARQAKNVETVKAVIYLIGAVICGVEFAMELTADATVVGSVGTAGFEQVCKITAIAGNAAGLVADIAGKAIINDSKEKYGQAKDQVCSATTFTPLIMSAIPLLSSSAPVVKATADKAASKAKSGCILCILMMGITGGMSVQQANASKDAQKAAVESAKGVKAAAKDTVGNMVATNVPLNGQEGIHSPSAPNNGSPTTSPAASDSCNSQSGNQYLSCIGTKAPEVAALTNSPEFLNQMQKSLHGKNLGDFVKGYKGESNQDLANYVAAGLEVSPAYVSKALENSQKIANDTQDKYQPSGYTRAGGSAPKSGGEDLDFSKMMAGLMGKMNPDAKDKKAGDPSDLVFRQLELLPADKIQANKDISLFARIAFRYRKNADNVDQLNWSRPENQSAAPQKK